MGAQQPIRIRQHVREILLVEGKDEEGFFASYIKYHKISTSVQIIDAGGVTNFKSRLYSIARDKNFPDVKVLGVVRDAECDASSAFDSVVACLRDYAPNFPIPKQSQAVEKSDDGLKCGIMIIPPGCASGMLEDLCLRSVADSRQMQCVNEFIDCLKRRAEFDELGHFEAKQNKFPRNLSKAKMLAFLASQPEDVVRLGIAADKQYWPFGNVVFDPLKAFLKDLFG